jgi:hypothetical protein
VGLLGLDGRDSRKTRSDVFRLLDCDLSQLLVFLLLLLKIQGLLLYLFEHLFLFAQVCLEVVRPEFGKGPFLGNAASSRKALSSTIL